MHFYKDQLDEFVEWLNAYGRLPLTCREATGAINKVRKLATRNVSKNDALGMLHYASEVNHAVQELLLGEYDFDGLYDPEKVMDHDKLWGTVQILEAGKFRKVMDTNYRVLYNKYDRATVRLKFNTVITSLTPVKGFHKAMKIVTDTADKLAGDYPDEVTDLYIAIRDMETHKPVLLEGLSFYLSDMYQDRTVGIEQAEEYLYRLNGFRVALQKTLSYYGKLDGELVAIPDSNVQVEILDDVLDIYVNHLLEIYEELTFARILRVV